MTHARGITFPTWDVSHDTPEIYHTFLLVAWLGFAKQPMTRERNHMTRERYHMLHGKSIIWHTCDVLHATCLNTHLKFWYFFIIYFPQAFNQTSLSLILTTSSHLSTTSATSTFPFSQGQTSTVFPYNNSTYFLISCITRTWHAF